MRLVELIAELEAEALKLRRLAHLALKDEFRVIWESISREKQIELIELIKTRNELEVKEFLASVQLTRGYEHWLTRDLKFHARGLGVAYYGRMDKEELILEIRRNEHRIRELTEQSETSSRAGGLGYRPPTETFRDIPHSQ